MLIQINEIEKDYFDIYVIMSPTCHEDEMTEAWQKKYGVAFVTKKMDIFYVMKEMDNWCCNTFGKSCYFEFG